MKIIRKKVFEVNSSSSHSVSRTEADFIFETIYPNSEGFIILKGGEYGWEWFKTNDSLEKANYVAQYLYNIDSDNEHKSLDSLKELIEEMTECEVIINIDDLENGFIDHQSSDILDSMMCDYLIDKDLFRDFIFNKNYWLFGGNDNNVTVEQNFDVPTFTKEGVIEVVYLYTLNIKYKDSILKTDLKFKEYPTIEKINDYLYYFFSDKRLITENDSIRVIEHEYQDYVDWKDRFAINQDVSSFEGLKENKVWFINENNIYHGYNYSYLSEEEKKFLKDNLPKLEKFLDYEIVRI